MKRPAHLLLALLAAWLCAAALPAFGFCGFYAGRADARLFNRSSQVILTRDGLRTVISMENNYDGPLSEFALVVPTPTVITKGQVRVVDPALFKHLDAYSAPRLVEYYDSNPCVMDFHWGEFAAQGVSAGMPMRQFAPAPAAVASDVARAKALGVTVEAHYNLEEYDIVSLSATQSDGLETWLRENGYRIPEGASAALRPYINQGMKFFVARVNLEEQKRTGYIDLRPLQFAFESPKFMLPMRLGMLNAPPHEAQDLIVYVLTRNGRVESSNYHTVRLPTAVNIPYFVKPRFTGFYKAMFEKQAASENHSAVFTEYFWNMGWCDPCADQPLAQDELRAAGVFWLDGDDNATFQSFLAPPTPGIVRRVPRLMGGAVPVQLTRLHVRYTASTFPEDLMFTQTRDSENWQARYIIQNPFQGDAAACSNQMIAVNCESLCAPRVSNVIGVARATGEDDSGGTHDRWVLERMCTRACTVAKHDAIDRATRYFRTELPERIASEKVTLATLTGWSHSEIEAIPGAGDIAAASEDEDGWWNRFASRSERAR